MSTVSPFTSTRSHVAAGYHKPNEAQENMVVLTGAQVTKIVMEPDKDGLNRAVGIDFAHDGQAYQLRGIRKDIILSAGNVA